MCYENVASNVTPSLLCRKSVRTSSCEKKGLGLYLIVACSSTCAGAAQDIENFSPSNSLPEISELYVGNWIAGSLRLLKQE